MNDVGRTVESMRRDVARTVLASVGMRLVFLGTEVSPHCVAHDLIAIDTAITKAREELALLQEEQLQTLIEEAPDVADIPF